YFLFGWHLDELHVIWAHLKKKRTRLRTNTMILKDLCSQSLETVSPSTPDAVTLHLVTTSHISRRRSISTWEDLTTRFLAQFFPGRRTAKLHNDILMFQQHHRQSLSKAWTRFKDLLQKNDPRDFAMPVKEIMLPQDVASASDRHLIELKNQVQCLMEAHLAPTQPTQVHKITTLCEICSGPHNTQNCVENPKQAFVEYASSRTDEAGGRWYTFKPEQNNLGYTYNPSWKSHPNLRASQDARLSKLEADFKRQQATLVKVKPRQPKEPKPSLEDEFKDLHLNLPVLKVLAHAPIYNAILDKYVETLELGKTSHHLFKVKHPQRWETSDYSLYLVETGHIFGLANGTKSYPVGIVKYVQVHIGKLKLLNDFYVLDMKKEPETPLLVGRIFLATANVVVDCRMAKIVVGEGITWPVFGVKGVDLSEEEAPYWTTLRKRESYKPQPSSKGVGTKPPYYARKDFLDCHLPGE
nr:hypothetical protein [Tanacetum cinerariifolium]